MRYFFLPLAVAMVVLRCLSQAPMDPAEALAGKNVVVCGASKGIGRELAWQYSSAGANVFLIARDGKMLDELAANITASHTQANVFVKAIDLSTEAGADSLVSHVSEIGWKHIDVLCLNHVVGLYGYYLRTFKDSTDLSKVTKSFQINALSYMWIATKAMPLMQMAPDDAQLLVVSSLAGKIGVPLTTGACFVLRVPPASAHARSSPASSLPTLPLSLSLSPLLLLLLPLALVNPPRAHATCHYACDMCLSPAAPWGRVRRHQACPARLFRRAQARPGAGASEGTKVTVKKKATMASPVAHHMPDGH
jgi:NAD(P)-dependent dehydrogenase (short-subunit alcohol dehydrogenase family)